MAATNVGHPRTALELFDHAVERGQPARQQVGVVAGPEEPFAALEDIVPVLMPPHSATSACSLDDARGIVHGPERDLEESGEEHGAVGICERDCLLRRERVPASLRVVFDKRTGCLSVEPLANVALRGPGAL